MVYERVDCKPKNGYTMMPKDMLFDAALSLKEKGIAAIAFRLPDDWNFKKENFINKSSSGRTSVDNGINGLISKGYLIIDERSRSSSGLLGKTNYHFFDRPQESRGVIEDAKALNITPGARVTKMTNYHLDDTNLSLEEKGFMSIILALPPETQFSMKKFERIVSDGKKSISTVLNELEKHGYLDRLEQDKAKNGQFASKTYIFYSKVDGNERIQYTTVSRNPQLDKPQQVEPQQETEQLPITNKLNTYKPNTDKTTTGYIKCTPINNIGYYGEFKNVKLLLSEYEKLKELYPDKYERAIEEASKNINNGIKCNSPLNYILGIIRNLMPTPVIKIKEAEAAKASYDLDKFRQDSIHKKLVYEPRNA